MIAVGASCTTVRSRQRVPGGPVAGGGPPGRPRGAARAALPCVLVVRYCRYEPNYSDPRSLHFDYTY